MALCALSAHTLPTLTTLSKLDSLPNRACAAAARNLAIFCCGVSPVDGDDDPPAGPPTAAPGRPIGILLDGVNWEGLAAA